MSMQIPGTASNLDDNLVRGDRVFSLMWKRKVRSMSALAARVHIDATTLRRKMAGERRWYLHEVRDIAEVLETTTSYLIGESDVEDAPNKESSTVESSSKVEQEVKQRPTD